MLATACIAYRPKLRGLMNIRQAVSPEIRAILHSFRSSFQVILSSIDIPELEPL